MASHPDTRVSREEEVTSLRKFQADDLSQLRRQLAALEVDIASAERAVAEGANLLSAARGVVGVRGGVVSSAGGHRRRADARSRTKQRLWTKCDGGVVRVSGEEELVEVCGAVQPIGVVYTRFRKRFEAPRQSFQGPAGDATVVVVSGDPRVNAVFDDLRPGQRLWLVYWLDRNSGLWRHFVRPPRAKGFRVGLFATRSPNRPSPVGLTLCTVQSVDVNTRHVFVSGVDVLDETPLLGLRRYDASLESFPEAKAGWLDEEGKVQPLYYDDVDNEDEGKKFSVTVEPAASRQLDFINERSAINVWEMVKATLERLELGSMRDKCDEALVLGDASKSIATGIMPVGTFRVSYCVCHGERSVSVVSIASGMREEVCLEECAVDPEARLHLDFQREFRSAT